jgi:succinate-semialdehyde dehydrogenase/glutarate-semialdehyde dehydrogenase
VNPNRKIAVRNPVTGQTDYRLHPPHPDTVGELAVRARNAQMGWQRLSVDERIAALRELVAAIERHREAIVQALSVDTGRSAVSRLEVQNFGMRLEQQLSFAAEIDAWATMETPVSAGVRGLRQLHPYPLVVNLTPWNFPFSLGWLDTVPALLAGSAVIVKPSEIAPRFAEPLQAAVDTVPILRDVVRFLPGDARLAETLIKQADFVCFTGSTATGRLVAAQAAARLIPCCLELGGKDPLVVLDDANLEAAAQTAVIGATIATGQICTAVERVYVQRSIHDKFVERCVEIAEVQKLNLDDPDGPGLGPFIHAPQADTYRRHIEDACERGGLLHTGGEVIERGGLWASPAVLSRLSHEMLIMREETFGPAVPIMAFEHDDEAVELSNDCRYGLGAAVFSADDERAARIARRLRAGAVAINGWDAPRSFPSMPYDAFGDSGLGPSRGGWDSILRFTRRTAIAAMPAA